jgi:hypothetical protein
MTLAPLIRSALDSAAERRQQRRRLVSTLILAQLLLTLAVSVGYLGSRAPLPVLLALTAALSIYLLAFIVNHLLHHATVATYILVVGGGAAVTAQVAMTALSGTPLDTGQAALFFLAIVLEAGLLLSSEVTLIIAATAAVLTASAVLLSLSLDPAVSHREAYLVMVYTLSLQALVGLISWLLAQFISESVDDSQRSQELQFAQARLEALRGQTEAQRQQQIASIARIQATITRVFAGDYSLRVDIADGDLSDLANSINLLLRRVEAASQVEQERARMDAAAVPLMEQLGHMADPATPAPSSLPLMTNTPMDSISIAVSHSQANIAHRLARVQSLASDVAGAVAHSHEGLSGATNEVQEAQRLAGLLISMIEGILTSTRKQLDLVTRTRRNLAGLLPPEITLEGQADAHRAGAGMNAEEASKLQGLGLDLGLASPGLTDEFQTMSPPSVRAGQSAPLAAAHQAPGNGDGTTVPLSAAELDARGVTVPLGPHSLGGYGATVPAPWRGQPSSSGSTQPALSGALPGEVIEAWRLLAQVADELGQGGRGISNLTRELGMLSRAVRQADVGMAWTIQALDAVRRGAEQLQQVAGSPLPPPEPGDPYGDPRTPNPTRPLMPGGGPRVPQLSRPLTDGADPNALRDTSGELGSSSNNPAPGSVRGSDLINPDDLAAGEPPRA